MRKIHVTQQFFEASGPQGHFVKKVFRSTLGEGAYEIRSLRRFSFGQGIGHIQTHTYTHEHTNIRANIWITTPDVRLNDALFMNEPQCSIFKMSLLNGHKTKQLGRKMGHFILVKFVMQLEDTETLNQWYEHINRFFPHNYTKF